MLQPLPPVALPQGRAGPTKFACIIVEQFMPSRAPMHRDRGINACTNHVIIFVTLCISRVMRLRARDVGLDEAQVHIIDGGSAIWAGILPRRALWLRDALEQHAYDLRGKYLGHMSQQFL